MQRVYVLSNLTEHRIAFILINLIIMQLPLQQLVKSAMCNKTLLDV